eukprot:m.164552 g.164552  ORF g.164552 m.164552 type:complete len:1213 (+) comp15241_c0_seq1:163-3801(+)
MENCKLGHLGLEGFEKFLKPKFATNVLKYSAVLGNDVKEVAIDCFADEADATVTVSGDIGGRKVPLSLGDNTISVEVTAPDNTTKRNYVLLVTRLPLDDASLHGLTIKSGTGKGGTSGKLFPAFSSKVFLYSASVPPHVVSVVLTPKLRDPKVIATVNGGDSKSPVSIGTGETRVEIKVLAADKVSSQMYTISIYREKLNVRPRLLDEKEKLRSVFPVLCPLCLGPLHRPTLALDDKIPFCSSCLSLLTRRVRLTPLSRENITKIMEDDKTEKVANDVLSKCLWFDYGCSESTPMSQLGMHARECKKLPQQCHYCLQWMSSDAMDTHKKGDDVSKMDCMTQCSKCKKYVGKRFSDIHETMCGDDNILAKCDPDHQIKRHSWEAQLEDQVATSTSSSTKDAEKVLKRGLTLEKQYLSSHPLSSTAAYEKLLLAAANYTSEKFSGDSRKIAEIHLRLGFMMEEQYHLAESHPNLKEQVDLGKQSEDTMKDMGSDANKNDDIRAICKLHGVGRSASLPEILVAIDKEYKKLISEGNSSRADYVQGLWAWKSKDAVGTATESLHPGNDRSTQYLGMTLAKYKDAKTTDPSQGLAYLHIGRVLLLLGNPAKALPWLKVAFRMLPDSESASFLLGIAAQSSDIEGMDEKSKLKDLYVHGRESLYMHRALQQLELIPKKITLHAVAGFAHLDPVTASSLLLLESSYTPEAEVHAKRASLTLAVEMYNHPRYGTSRENAQTSHYQVLEQGLFHAHAICIHSLLGAKQEVSMDMCERLCKIVQSLSLVDSGNTQETLLAIAQAGLQTLPRSLELLVTLGTVQLKLFDRMSAEGQLTPGTTKWKEAQQLMDDAEASFRAALEVEGKSKVGTLPTSLSKQNWWKKSTSSQKESSSKPVVTNKQNGIKGKEGPSAKTGSKPGAGPKTYSISTATSRRPAASRSGVGSTTSKPVAGRRVAAGGGAAAARTLSTATPASRRNGTNKAAPTTSTNNSTMTTTPRARGGGRQLGRVARQGKSPTVPTTPSPKGQQPTRGAEAKLKPQENKSENMQATPPQSEKQAENGYSAEAHMGLGRILLRRIQNKEISDDNEMKSIYLGVIEKNPRMYDAYIEFGEYLAPSDACTALDIYDKYPVSDTPSSSDGYIHGEALRLLMKMKDYKDPRIEKHLIGYAKVNGMNSIEKEMRILDEQFKYSSMLCRVHATVNGKSVDDEDLQPYFKMRGWR